MKNIIFFLLIIHIKKFTSEGNEFNSNTEYVAKNIHHNSSKLKETPEILGTPEALVRYKHNIPITIIKYKTRVRRRRPNRRRVKPKAKYGSVSFYGEPLSYYKPLDHAYESHQINNKFNDYESFYKELDPDFNFEDTTFLEYDKQPILLNFYNKNKAKQKLSKNRLNREKSNQKENEMTHLKLEEEQPEDTIWYDTTKPKKMLKKTFENQKASTKIKLIEGQNTKENKKFHIPHTKYGIPSSEYNEEYEIPQKITKYNFGEPTFKTDLHHIQYNKGYILNSHQLNHYFDSTESTLEHISYKPTQFIKQPDENYYNGYFAEPPDTYNKIKWENNIQNYQQKLPLQNDVKLNYKFPKSSYDVPVYDTMSFKNNEATSDSYPPLTDSGIFVPESQSSPSKISLTYITTNKTFTPLGYFVDNPKNNSKLFIFDSKQKSSSNKQIIIDNNQNKTRRRKLKNKNINRMKLSTNLFSTKKTFEEDYDVQLETENKFNKNDETINSYHLTTHVPLNLLLLSSAKRNLYNQIASSSWDPMKVTSYSFKIDHSNISASIPNIKTYKEIDEHIITTTSNYNSKHKAKNKKNLSDIHLLSTRKSKQHIYPRTLSSNFVINDISNNNKSIKYSSERNQYNSDVNVYQIPNLTLIQDPFDFNEKQNKITSEKRPLRFKNHRYNQ